MQRPRRLSGFTLLEIMIALGIMAIGLSAALGLFTAAAASGRRAELYVDSSHVADAVIAEVETVLTLDFDFGSLPLVTAQDLEAMGLEPQQLGAPPADDGALGDPDLDEEDGAPEANRAGEVEGFRFIVKEEALPGFDDYKVWVVLSALPEEPDPPNAFFCEVFVRWSFKGKRRGAQFQTVLLRRLSRADLPR